MSLEATIWAIGLREDAIDSGSFRVLAILANHAHSDGRNAFRSAASVAAQLGVSKRTIQRRLSSLRDAGLIQYGNQALTAHIPAHKRPAVYDLQLGVSPTGQRQALPMDDPDMAVDTPGESVDNSIDRGDKSVTPRQTGVTTGVTSGVTTGVATGVTPGVTQTVSKNHKKETTYVPKSPTRDDDIHNVDCPRCSRPLTFDRNGPKCSKCAGQGIDPLRKPECPCGNPLPREYYHGEKCGDCRRAEAAAALTSPSNSPSTEG